MSENSKLWFFIKKLTSLGTFSPPIPIAEGGTNATSQSAARTSLDVHSKSEGLATANNLNDLNDAPIARTNLGLGSAAVENVGVTPNNVVQLDGSSRLPAVDGSRLTNLSFLFGTVKVIPDFIYDVIASDDGKLLTQEDSGISLNDFNLIDSTTLTGDFRIGIVLLSGLAPIAIRPSGSDTVNGGTADIILSQTHLIVTCVLDQSIGNWVVSPVDILLAKNNLNDVSSASTSRNNLGLGTAAVEDVGTGANDVVQLDGSAKLPAVDGSQLTNIPALSFRGALVYSSASFSIPNNLFATLSWDSEEYDTDNIHDLIVNSSRLVVPVGVSKVILKAQVIWETNSVGVRQLHIDKNGSISYRGSGSDERAPSSVTNAQMGVTTAPLIVVPGDYFETTVAHNSGSNLSVFSSFSTWFSMLILE